VCSHNGTAVPRRSSAFASMLDRVPVVSFNPDRRIN
jgi:hypothetical protein